MGDAPNKQSMATTDDPPLGARSGRDSVGAGSSSGRFYRCDMGWKEVTVAGPVI